MTKRLLLYRKFRYRKGHGVHSPFVYSFITKVIEEKASFYAFDKIEKLRKEIALTNTLSGQLTIREAQHRNYGALLFRIVNFFNCNTVLQIGGSTGIMSLYLAMAAPKSCRCYVLEQRSGILAAAEVFSATHGLNHIHFMEGNYEESLKTLHSVVDQVDLLFINEHSHRLDMEKTVDLCRTWMNKKNILIINNIFKDKGMQELWQKIKTHSRSRVTIDLYALGIVFFDEKLPKKHYKTYFNYGKQNLHKNRRRGLYLFGRREKSAKNQFTD